MTDDEIRKSVDKAFREIGREKAERAQARKNSAESARDRMIKRQTSRSRKDDGTGWSKPPLWSN